MKLFFGKILRALASAGLAVVFFLEVYVVASIAVSPFVCILWVLKDVFGWALLQRRFAFTIIWTASCVLFALFYAIKTSLEYRKITKLK